MLRTLHRSQLIDNKDVGKAIARQGCKPVSSAFLAHTALASALKEHTSGLNGMQSVKLNTGVQLPSIGYGTFLLQPKQTQQLVRTALELGYR